MKSKYLALGLSCALMLGLVTCGHQAELEPQEPAQEIQQVEPVTMEPTAPPVETELTQTPSITKPPEAAPTAQQGDGGTIIIKDTVEQKGGQVQEQDTSTVWDQAFSDTLTPQQQNPIKMQTMQPGFK